MLIPGVQSFRYQNSELLISNTQDKPSSQQPENLITIKQNALFSNKGILFEDFKQLALINSSSASYQ